MIRKASHGGTRCAGADALPGWIIPACERVAPPDVSGLAAPVLVAILLGIGMGRRAGVMGFECWFDFLIEIMGESDSDGEDEVL